MEMLLPIFCILLFANIGIVCYTMYWKRKMDKSNVLQFRKYHTIGWLRKRKQFYTDIARKQKARPVPVDRRLR